MLCNKLERLYLAAFLASSNFYDLFAKLVSYKHKLFAGRLVEIPVSVKL